MDDFFTAVMVVGMLFIGLPWLVLHYVTRWKANSSLTNEDEKMLDDLYDLARRLDDRMDTIERIVADENPNWRTASYDAPAPRLEKAEVHDLGPRLNKDRGAVSHPNEGRL